MSAADERLEKRFKFLILLGLLQFLIATSALVFALVMLYEIPLGQWSAVVTCVFAMLPFLVDFMLVRKVSTFIKTGERQMPITSTETRRQVDLTSRYGEREIEKTTITTKMVTVPEGYTVWHFESLQPQTLAKYTSLIVLSFIVCLAGGITLEASLALAGSPASDSIGAVAVVLVVAYTLMIFNIALLKSAHGILSRGVEAQK
nr:hypothetical protein [Candidatus Njordarchaeota archaeon]